MADTEIQRPRLLSRGEDPAPERSGPVTILNLDKYREETQKIRSERIIAGDNLNRYVSLRDEPSGRMLDNLSDKQEEIISLTPPIIEGLKKHPIGKTMYGYNFCNILEASAGFLVDRTIERQRKLAERLEISYFHEPLAQLNQFYMFGEQSLKIGGLSMKDFVDKPVSPAAAYVFIVEACLIPINLTHARILQENQTPLTTSYPNLTIEKIEVVAEQISSIANFNPKALEILTRSFFPHASGTVGEITAKAREILNKMSAAKRDIHDTIIDPTSPEFPSLKKAAENYLSTEDLATRTRALTHLGLNTKDSIIDAYRRAETFAQNKDENFEFYTILRDSIRTFAEEMPSTVQILTKDDLPSIIDSNINPDSIDIPTLEHFKKQAVALSQKPLKTEYSINPQDIDWKNLIPPTSTQIKFIGTSNKFNISIHYQNEEGETLNIPLTFDLVKGVFDWGFMEGPNDPEMQAMRNTAFLVTQSILSDVQKQAEAEYQQKQIERQQASQTPHTTRRESPSKEPYVPREKIARQRKTRPSQVPSQEEDLQIEEIPISIQPQRERVKRYMVLEEENIRSMIPRISQENQDRIIEGIKGFNERGTGKFKHMTDMLFQGKPVYELRVGRFRALTTRTNPTDDDVAGRRDPFVIHKIDDRSRIFRNN